MICSTLILRHIQIICIMHHLEIIISLILLAFELTNYYDTRKKCVAACSAELRVPESTPERVRLFQQEPEQDKEWI